jgi:hypothetical protein
MVIGTSSPRTLLLGKTAAEAGVSWARRCMVDFRAEGRAVTGGWPGTRSEARSLVGRHLAREGCSPTHDELEWLVTEAYSRARDTWLAAASVERDPTE